MRGKSFSVSILAVAAVLIMGLGVAPLQASQYLGEVTWNANTNEDGNFTIKAGISKVGGSYYEVQGQVPNVPGNGGTAIFAGGGVLVGNNVIATVTVTVANGNEILIMQINIDKTTNNGTFWIREAYLYLPHGDQGLNAISDPFPAGGYPGDGTFQLTSRLWSLGNQASTGTLTTSNPIPLAPGTTSAVPLLLE